MSVEQVIINKFAHQLAYDLNYEIMSKHNGRMTLILDEYINRDNNLPLKMKKQVKELHLKDIIYSAERIFNEEVMKIRNYCFEKEEEKEFLVWGKKISKNELFLMRGFVIRENGKLDYKIHRSQDVRYFEQFKNNPQLLIKSINDRSSYGGMSGPYDFLDSEVENFNKCPIPLEFLEPSIALLCKLLPMFGINTIYSCSGHQANVSSPEISFRTLDDFQRAQLLLEEDEIKKLIASYDKFVLEYNYDSKSWMGKKLIFKMEDFSSDGYNSTYWSLFEVSKHLLSIYKKSMM